MNKQDGYLFTKVNFGGEIVTRGEVYRQLGLQAADAWLSGYDRTHPTADFGRLVDEASDDEVDPDTLYRMDDSGRGYGSGPR